MRTALDLIRAADLLRLLQQAGLETETDVEHVRRATANFRQVKRYQKVRNVR